MDSPTLARSAYHQSVYLSSTAPSAPLSPLKPNEQQDFLTELSEKFGIGTEQCLKLISPLTDKNPSPRYGNLHENVQYPGYAVSDISFGITSPVSSVSALSGGFQFQSHGKRLSSMPSSPGDLENLIQLRFIPRPNAPPLAFPAPVPDTQNLNTATEFSELGTGLSQAPPPMSSPTPISLNSAESPVDTPPTVEQLESQSTARRESLAQFRFSQLGMILPLPPPSVVFHSQKASSPSSDLNQLDIASFDIVEREGSTREKNPELAKNLYQVNQEPLRSNEIHFRARPRSISAPGAAGVRKSEARHRGPQWTPSPKAGSLCARLTRRVRNLLTPGRKRSNARFRRSINTKQLLESEFKSASSLVKPGKSLGISQAHTQELLDPGSRQKHTSLSLQVGNGSFAAGDANPRQDPQMVLENENAVGIVNSVIATSPAKNNEAEGSTRTAFEEVASPKLPPLEPPLFDQSKHNTRAQRRRSKSLPSGYVFHINSIARMGIPAANSLTSGTPTLTRSRTSAGATRGASALLGRSGSNASMKSNGSLGLSRTRSVSDRAKYVAKQATLSVVHHRAELTKDEERQLREHPKVLTLEDTTFEIVNRKGTSSAETTDEIEPHVAGALPQAQPRDCLVSPPPLFISVPKLIRGDRSNPLTSIPSLTYTQSTKTAPTTPASLHKKPIIQALTSQPKITRLPSRPRPVQQSPKTPVFPISQHWKSIGTHTHHTQKRSSKSGVKRNSMHRRSNSQQNKIAATKKGQIPPFLQNPTLVTTKNKVLRVGSIKEEVKKRNDMHLKMQPGMLYLTYSIPNLGGGYDERHHRMKPCSSAAKCRFCERGPVSFHLKCINILID